MEEKKRKEGRDNKKKNFTNIFTFLCHLRLYLNQEFREGFVKKKKKVNENVERILWTKTKNKEKKIKLERWIQKFFFNKFLIQTQATNFIENLRSQYNLLIKFSCQKLVLSSPITIRSLAPIPEISENFFSFFVKKSHQIVLSVPILQGWYQISSSFFCFLIIF